MHRNLLFALMILLVCVQLSEESNKYRKGGNFGSRRRDSDGFGSFGRASKKDFDSFIRRSASNDDDLMIGTSGKYSRRTNYYAGKKLEGFGDRMGKGIGSFFLGLIGMDTESQPKTVSGKKIKSSINVQKSNHDLTYDWLSNTIIVVAAILGISLICFVVIKRPFSSSQEDIMITKARDRYKDTYKNYQILMYIKENGVHPHRATGQIYQIKL